MGRPREFDEARVVAAAGAVFRQRGYAASSIDDLVDATGVHRGSLYGTFGSKQGLFLRVLEASANDSADHDRREERLDVLLVALLELAPTDTRIRERVGQLIHASSTTPEALGRRLLTRAGIALTEGESE